MKLKLILLALLAITVIAHPVDAQSGDCWYVEIISGHWPAGTTGSAVNLAKFPIGSSDLIVALSDYERIGYVLPHEGFITNITLVHGDNAVVVGLALNTNVFTATFTTEGPGFIEFDDGVYSVNRFDFLSAFRSDDGGDPVGFRWTAEYHYFHPYPNSCGQPGNGGDGEFINTWEGAWDPNLSYDQGALVHHDGSAWLALENMTSGQEPGVHSDWDLVAQQGDIGPEGPQGLFISNWTGVWQNETVYNKGDLVSHNSAAWVAINTTTNEQPGTSTNWELVASGGGSITFPDTHTIEPLASLIPILFLTALIIFAEWKRDPIYYILAGILGLFITINLPEVFPEYTRVFLVAISLYLILRAYLSYSDARMASEPMDDV